MRLKLRGGAFYKHKEQAIALGLPAVLTRSVIKPVYNMYVCMYVLVSGRAEESTSHQRPHLDGRDVSRQPATESRTFV